MAPYRFHSLGVYYYSSISFLFQFVYMEKLQDLVLCKGNPRQLCGEIFIKGMEEVSKEYLRSIRIFKQPPK